MATIYFQLERSKTLKDGTHPIYLVVKDKEAGVEKRFRHYTGRSALSKHWIGKGKNKKVTGSAPGAGITNERLNNLRAGVEGILINAKNLRTTLGFDLLKVRFAEEVLGKSRTSINTTAQLSFFDHLNRFIEAKAGVLQPSTIKTYVTLKKSLLDFERSMGYKVEFESINHAFITLYTKYLIDDTGVLNNTLAKRIATLKAFLSEMKKQKVNSCFDFESFTASRNYDTTIMYLTGEELARLKRISLRLNSTEDHIRDAFCFACETGIRFSDWEHLTTHNIHTVPHEGENIKVVKFTMFKVHKEVTVPLTDYALKIIAKYKNFSDEKGQLFPTYTNQESNRTLKHLAQQAGIDSIIVDIKKSGSTRKNFKNPKYEVLSCHDARNTFATLYLETGGRPEILKKLLGHSDIKQTMRYVKITEKAVIEDHVKINSRREAVIVKLKKPA